MIVGGGMAARAAVKGIRKEDPTGTVAVLSAETFPPYDRPPLSKALFRDKPLSSVWRSWDPVGVDLFLTTRAVAVDPDAHTVRDATGRVFRYSRLLLATGGDPITVPEWDPRVVYYRTLQDYLTLMRRLSDHTSVAVVGGGFIGAEMAAALADRVQHVVHVMPETAILGRLLPADLAEFVTQYYRQHGITVETGHGVRAVRSEGARLLVETEAGRTHTVDVVVAGLGIRPAVDLAVQAGIRVSDGIEVDSRLMTSAPDVYAAGDVAAPYVSALGRRIRVEHEDAALVMGRDVGRSMAGADVAYDYLPFFYSDLFDLGFEAIGVLDSRLTTVSDWQDPYRTGIVYYLDAMGHVVGVLLWNVWDRVPAARALITSHERFDPPASVRGRIPFGS